MSSTSSTNLRMHVGEPGEFVGPFRVPPRSPVTVAASILDPAGANSLRVILRGSRDGVNWDDLVDLGPVTGIPGAHATVEDPPPFVGVQLTPDAPALWSGQILARISLSSKLGFVEEESVAEPAMPAAIVEAIEEFLAPLRKDLDPTSKPKTPYPLFPDPFAPASAT